MATASQKMTEIRFLVLMRGALTPPPTMLVPVVWMPLCLESRTQYVYISYCVKYSDSMIIEKFKTYRAAPTTDSDTAKPMPVVAHMYGDVDVRNQPTLTRSPLPVRTWYITETICICT